MSYYQPPTSDDEDDLEEFETTSGRDGLIFVIDGNDEIFKEDDSNPAKIRTIFDCIETALKNVIINSPNDLVGVVFYNLKNDEFLKPSNSNSSEIVAPKHCSIFLPMNVISKTSIELINNFFDMNYLNFLENNVGSDISTNISDVLWLCSRMISRCGFKLQTSTIVFFTNNDQPHSNGSNEFQQAFIRANDLLNSKVSFVLVPMSETFNGEHFYNELFCTINETDTPRFLTTDAMLNRIYQKNFRKHCFRHLKMSIGPEVLIGVSLYTCTQRTKYPKVLKILRETNEPIIAKRAYMLGEFDSESMEYKFERPLLPSEMRKSIQIGNEKIIFTAEEISSMNSLMEPGIRLLGFKPKSTISIHHFLKPAYFLFFDETLIKGSAKLFRALWDKCLQKEKVAICVLTQRRKVTPKYVALVPQMEKYENDVLKKQNGFIVVFLPSESNIRHTDYFESNNSEPRVIEQEKIDVMKKVIKKIRFHFDPRQFDNPFIKYLYSHIEANAFDTDKDIEFEDSTLPDIEYQDKKLQPVIEGVTDMFKTFIINTEKRPNSDKEQGPKTKAQRLNVNENVNFDEIRTAVQNDTAEKYPVSVLKNYLQHVGAKGISKMNKAALIDKIKEYL